MEVLNNNNTRGKDYIGNIMTINFVMGTFYFGINLRKKLGISEGDYITFLYDEKSKVWYVAVSEEAEGFRLRLAGTGGTLGFGKRGVTTRMKKTYGIASDSKISERIPFLVASEPTISDGYVCYALTKQDC